MAKKWSILDYKFQFQINFKYYKEELSKSKVAKVGLRPGLRQAEKELRAGFRSGCRGRLVQECAMCSMFIMNPMDRTSKVIKEVDMGGLEPGPITLTQPLNCRSKRVVYIGGNTITRARYAGMTKREVRKRMAEHVRAIRNKEETHPIGSHFKEFGHGVEHFTMVPIMQVRGDAFALRALEKKIIERYKLVDLGLNRQR